MLIDWTNTFSFGTSLLPSPEAKEPMYGLKKVWLIATKHNVYHQTSEFLPGAHLKTIFSDYCHLVLRKQLKCI